MVTDSDELSDEEKSMIHEVIDLGDTKAREVMVPRGLNELQNHMQRQDI